MEEQPFPFLDLPAEIRPRPKYDSRYDDYEGYAKPEWQLLLVSSQVHEEASKVLFSNFRVVGFQGMNWEYFAKMFDYDDNQLSVMRLMEQHVSFASVTLDVRGLAEDAADVA